MIGGEEDPAGGTGGGGNESAKHASSAAASERAAVCSLGSYTCTHTDIPSLTRNARAPVALEIGQFIMRPEVSEASHLT